MNTYVQHTYMLVMSLYVYILVKCMRTYICTYECLPCMRQGTSDFSDVSIKVPPAPEVPVCMHVCICVYAYVHIFSHACAVSIKVRPEQEIPMYGRYVCMCVCTYVHGYTHSQCLDQRGFFAPNVSICMYVYVCIHE